MNARTLLLAAVVSWPIAPPVAAQDRVTEARIPLDELPPLKAEERVHSATEGPFRVTTLWRSERGLEMFAKEALGIVVAVDAAGPKAAQRATDDTPVIELVIAESPLQVFKDSKWPEAMWPDENRAQILVNEWFRRGPTAAVAVAPRIHDRTMFGTGLPPATKRMVALATARRAIGLTSLPPDAVDGDAGLLLDGRAAALAQAGLEAAGFARPIDVEPFTSSGLDRLRRRLDEVPDDRRVAELVNIAGVGRTRSPRLWDGAAPWADDSSGAARMLMATAKVADDASLGARAAAALVRLDTLRPRWIVENGAVATHPYGWQAVATRKADALVLSAEPIGRDAFTLATKVAVFSNDLKVPGQADIVLGDEDGDRILLAMNTQEGMYIFRRAAHDAKYEIVGEVNRALMPVAREVDVEIRYDGEVLAVTVGGLPLAPVRLAERKLTGRWGFGAHAGSTAMFREFTIE